jgi:gamma-glutamyltranspeptidase/glutathione hydrolase
LASGGNAVDAAIACAFVQGVVDPQMCGIGGCGVMAVYWGGQTSVLEFYARAGSLVRPDMWGSLLIRESADRYGYVLEGAVNDVGYQSVAVPGTVAGLAEAHARFGSLPWARLVEPAIRLAADGFQVTGNLYGSWTAVESPDVVPWKERLGTTAESARLYLRSDGEFYEPGHILRNPDYAATLERLAAVGAVDFYRGEIAARIAADFAANGGHITGEDLASYRVRVAAPVSGSYRGLGSRWRDRQRAG